MGEEVNFKPFVDKLYAYDQMYNYEKRLQTSSIGLFWKTANALLNRWQRLGLSTAPARMSQTWSAASSV
uniref:Uncharacterized protein n=1 Tax=Anguilla anguilla TaxID=7936 RepID=A0A0E9VZA2_ANGAN